MIHKLQDEHHEDMLTSSFPVWSWPEVNPMGFSKRRVSADYPWTKSFEISVMVFHENCHKSARARKNRPKRLLEIKQNVTKIEKRNIFVPTNQYFWRNMIKWFLSKNHFLQKSEIILSIYHLNQQKNHFIKLSFYHIPKVEMMQIILSW